MITDFLIRFGIFFILLLFFGYVIKALTKWFKVDKGKLESAGAFFDTSNKRSFTVGAILAAIIFIFSYLVQFWIWQIIGFLLYNIMFILLVKGIYETKLKKAFDIWCVFFVIIILLAAVVASIISLI